MLRLHLLRPDNRALRPPGLCQLSTPVQTVGFAPSTSQSKYEHGISRYDALVVAEFLVAHACGRSCLGPLFAVGDIMDEECVRAVGCYSATGFLFSLSVNL